MLILRVILARIRSKTCRTVRCASHFFELGSNYNNNDVPLTESSDLELGSVIWNRYLNVNQSGHGGMSTMYFASHTQLGRVRTLKFICRKPSQHAGFLMHCRREAQAANMQRYPNVFDVVD